MGVKIHFGERFSNVVFGSSSRGVGGLWVVAEAQVGLFVVMVVENCWYLKVHMMVVEQMWWAGLVVVTLLWGIAVERPL